MRNIYGETEEEEALNNHLELVRLTYALWDEEAAEVRTRDNAMDPATNAFLLDLQEVFRKHQLGLYPQGKYMVGPCLPDQGTEWLWLAVDMNRALPKIHAKLKKKFFG